MASCSVSSNRGKVRRHRSRALWKGLQLLHGLLLAGDDCFWCGAEVGQDGSFCRGHFRSGDGGHGRRGQRRLIQRRRGRAAGGADCRVFCFRVLCRALLSFHRHFAEQVRARLAQDGHPRHFRHPVKRHRRLRLPLHQALGRRRRALRFNDGSRSGDGGDADSAADQLQGRGRPVTARSWMLPASRRGDVREAANRPSTLMCVY
mmetsp:Transcript_4759/g.15135  ORF Transcript_4759/g.15135 Transcript_4759/m.15135 type:complete len:204 (-) Transcript_4759:19-630(-)